MRIYWRYEKTKGDQYPLNARGGTVTCRTGEKARTSKVQRDRACNSQAGGTGKRKLILTQSFRARQPKSLLDDCNRESGRIYSQTVADHWRIYRKKDIWISQYSAMR